LIHHALNRGNNRQAVLTGPADFAAFLEALAQAQDRYPFRLYGFSLMTSDFHLQLEPEAGENISRIVQSLTVADTWRFHRGDRSLGHLWQGRFKSPVIQDDAHLLTVLRYIEANPLRGGMVKDLADYPWCSYPSHGLGRVHDLVNELPTWQRLRRTAAGRHAFGRNLVHTPLTARDLRRCGGP
jgi:putative transposase